MDVKSYLFPLRKKSVKSKANGGQRTLANQSEQSGTQIRNRLVKNEARLKAWVRQFGLDAYRLYERDIPDYPFIVDRYGSYFLIYDRSDDVIDQSEEKRSHLVQLVEAVIDIFQTDQEHIVLKRRQRQKGESQYEKADETGKTIKVREGSVYFKVNLFDYLDTGLFLDHRIMREKVRSHSAPGKEFLNLFSYTGSVSVFAALGGATTTSVDMSSTYSAWAQENFLCNNIDISMHRFLVENALEYLKSQPGKPVFDLIFCDPPTFSNSKKMSSDFEVERDQLEVIAGCMKILKRDGLLYFSNNKRTFKIAESVTERYDVKNITDKTLPKDFRDPKIHHVFEIRHRP
jgi:23S rRNA (cytosine1962-C5)-methyltransferase